MPRSSDSTLRFGASESDPAASGLQPRQLLPALLDEPGEMVSREALRRRDWPADTFVVER